MKEAKRKAHRRKDKATPPAVRATDPNDRLAVIRRLEWVCALALAALIVFLHLYRVTKAGGLWRDEANTLATATMPSFSEMWASLVYTRPPALPYAVIWIWADVFKFGAGDTSLRVLGGLTGIGILAALWWSSRLLRLQVPLLSLALFGLSPNVIQWGDSPRGYGLGALLILALFGLIWKVVESPTPLWIALATFFAVGGVQCVFHNAPLVFAICVGGFLVCWRKRLRHRGLLILGIGGVAALSILPYWHVIKAYQDTNVVALVLPSWGEVVRRSVDTLGSGGWAWLLCGAVSLLVASYQIGLKSREQDTEGHADRALFNLTVLLVGTAAYVLFLKAAHLTVFAWHCIPLFAVTALSMDVLIGVVNTTALRKLARVAVALAIAGATIPAAWNQASMRQTNLDAIAAAVQQQAAPGDLVVVNPSFLAATFQHYYRGQPAWMTVPPMEPVLTSGLLRLDLLRQEMAKQDALRPVFDAIARTLQSGNRVWWVGDLGGAPQGQPPPTLPSAPNGPNGWLLAEYQRIWTVQLGDFIVSHILEAKRVSVDINQPINPHEKTLVQYFKGWHP